MNFRKLICISAIVLGAIACKKDEETETLPSLDGYLTFQGLPEFISPGENVTLTPGGVEHPEGGVVGHYWKVIPSQTKYDTVDVFKHVFSDTLQTYTVYCYAFADGYSGMSSSKSCTAVAPGYNGSIGGIAYNKIADDSLYVRHMPYYYKEIGEQVWTINNMAVRSGIPFKGAEIMSEVFGRYYNYNDAKAACDSLDRDGQNWELPTLEDWKTLENHISGLLDNKYGKSLNAAMMAEATFNGTEMLDYWPVVGDIRNGSGFSAIPVGYSNTMASDFKGCFEYATFWTADEATEDEAYYKYFIYDQPEIFTSKGSKTSFGASVRCIRK